MHVSRYVCTYMYVRPVPGSRYACRPGELQSEKVDYLGDRNPSAKRGNSSTEIATIFVVLHA